MANTASLTAFNAPAALDQTGTRTTVRGVLSFAGSGGYTTGGVPTSYSPILNQSGASVPVSSLNAAPDEIKLESVTGSGYIYQRVKSTGAIKILQSPGAAGPLVEIAVGAAIPTDVVEFCATWVKQ